MSNKSEALQLADWAASYNMNMHNRAAAKLRRLSAVNKELLVALKQHVQLHDGDCICQDCAAIAKAEGQA